MDREVLWATVHRVANGWSDTTESTQHTQRKGQKKKKKFMDLKENHIKT